MWARVACKTDFRGLLGMDGAIPDLTALELHVKIQSPAGDEKIDELRRVWAERCPVYLALTKPQHIEMTFERAPARPDRPQAGMEDQHPMH
jgi:hypothetical protein